MNDQSVGFDEGKGRVAQKKTNLIRSCQIPLFYIPSMCFGCIFGLYRCIIVFGIGHWFCVLVRGMATVVLFMDIRTG